MEGDEIYIFSQIFRTSFRSLCNSFSTFDSGFDFDSTSFGESSMLEVSLSSIFLIHHRDSSYMKPINPIDAVLILLPIG